MAHRLGAALACVTLLAGGVAVAVPAQAATHYKNCTQVHRHYRGGIAKKGVHGDKVGGRLRAFKHHPYVNTNLYKANKKLDRDHDGIACEA